jgi:hypothetical protein
VVPEASEKIAGDNTGGTAGTPGRQLARGERDRLIGSQSKLVAGSDFAVADYNAARR